MNIPEEINNCEQIIDRIIDLSLSSVSSIPPNSTLKTEIFQTINKIEIMIQQYVYDILIDFPLLNDLEKYISDEIDILIDRSKYHYCLGELNRTVKDVEFVVQNYSFLFEGSNSPTTLLPIFKTVIGRICSILRNKSKPIEYLNHVIESFHSIPIIQSPFSTSIILGNKTDDLLFSIVMGGGCDIVNLDTSQNNNVNNNNNNNNNIEDNDDFIDEDEDIDYEDDKQSQQQQQLQQLIIRSYKFNDNSIYKDDYGTGVESSNPIPTISTARDQLLQQQKHFIKPFNIATVNNFQIIETPSLTLIKESKNSKKLLDMIKGILNNLETLILFNVDFQLDIKEQIDYYLNIKPYISRVDQCCLIFTNCQSSRDSLEFIEILKQRLISSNQLLEIPSIYIYEQHINQIKEHIIKYKNYQIPPFKNNGIDNLLSSLTMVEIQEQINKGRQQQQMTSDIDLDILDKINKLDLN
ncbi:hypothetical protein DICPUDRAFT_147490 [Dictyostelium purpureum]|uniref:NOG1 N-terminal helical domain-containing protein n=1 Tax=Dictyostelium purpureum TaxID=5786 RepID=F0Z8M6_DICPU|nr:uncharacterized protein DICPUDRAFT_147490 [Dictyostelium purpureum]EGC39659.1 hypothetical protein DICPUDRAFT_147490 [Dictyostelium purpureum]|eukprot:XP_003283768.1 hypothetical protein DICPUDRAFT_147490 [Dictyostelium purpureum]